MGTGAITSQIDVAQLALIAFFLFFLGLVFYLQSENNREGLPLYDDYGRKTNNTGISGLPSDKVFITAHMGNIVVPRREAEQSFRALNSAAYSSAPLQPVGNKLLSGLGPAAWAARADIPDPQFFGGAPRIVPLRADPELWIPAESVDPRGMNMVGADDLVAGQVSELWVDRTEGMLRYIEVRLVAELGGRTVLVPSNMVDIQDRHARCKVMLILAAQFADVPALQHADQITMLEEDKIGAYFAGGMLYATADRAEPLI